jgi:hypothetical protein
MEGGSAPPAGSRRAQVALLIAGAVVLLAAAVGIDPPSVKTTVTLRSAICPT